MCVCVCSNVGERERELETQQQTTPPYWLSSTPWSSNRCVKSSCRKDMRSFMSTSLFVAVAAFVFVVACGGTTVVVVVVVVVAVPRRLCRWRSGVFMLLLRRCWCCLHSCWWCSGCVCSIVAGVGCVWCVYGGRRGVWSAAREVRTVRLWFGGCVGRRRRGRRQGQFARSGV